MKWGRLNYLAITCKLYYQCELLLCAVSHLSTTLSLVWETKKLKNTQLGLSAVNGVKFSCQKGKGTIRTKCDLVHILAAELVKATDGDPYIILV